MGYSQENGYVPSDIDAIMAAFMVNINTQFGLSYTVDTFEGTNFYKYFYGIAQLLQENEIKTSEIFIHLQQYFEIINAQIGRPVVTNPGIIEKLEEAGYEVAVKPMIEADAGKVHVAVDVDDGVRAEGTVTITNFANLVSGTDDVVTINGTAFTAQVGAATLGTGTFQAATSNTATGASLALQINSHATASLVVRAVSIAGVVTITARHGGTAGNALTLAYTDNDTNIGATLSGATLSGGETNEDYAASKLEINTILSQCVVGGAVTQGTETSAIVFSNGQSFDYKFYIPNRIEVLLRLTLTLSENNQVLVGSVESVKAALLANIQAQYRIGKDFEPQRYYSVVDAPWAAQVLLEWSDDGGSTYYSTIFDSDYDDFFEVLLENISVVEV